MRQIIKLATEASFLITSPILSLSCPLLDSIIFLSLSYSLTLLFLFLIKRLIVFYDQFNMAPIPDSRLAWSQWDVCPFNMILSHWPCVFFPSKNIQGSVGSTSRWIRQSSSIILIPSSNMSVCLWSENVWVCMELSAWVVSDLTICLYFHSHNCWHRDSVAMSNLFVFRVTCLLTTASAWLTSDW